MANATAEITVSLPTAARRLGVSWQVAWRKLLRGELEGSMVGGRWRVSEESLRQAQEAQSDTDMPPAA